MQKERNALKAGLFIVVSTVLVVVVIIAIKGAGQFTEGRSTRVVSFKLTDDIGGLRAGDDVRVGGWKVGSIDSIKAGGLDGDDPRILVTFTLPSRFKIRENARIGIQTTLTGAAALNVENLGSGSEISPGQQIAGRPDPKSALFASLGEVGPDLAETMKQARLAATDIRAKTVPKANAALDSFKGTGDSAAALVGDVKGKLPPIVDRYNDVTDKTAAMMQSITDMIGPATTDWKGLMANLNQASGSINQKLPAMLEKLDTTLASAQAALEDVKKTVANTTELTASLKQVVGRNESKLEGIITGLKTTGDNLEAASAEIRRSPWRLLYKPAPNEVANLNVYDSARQFAEGATDLNDAASALRDALKTGGAKPEEIQAMIDRLDKTFNNFNDVEKKLWSEVKR